MLALAKTSRSSVLDQIIHNIPIRLNVTCDATSNGIDSFQNKRRYGIYRCVGVLLNFVYVKLFFVQCLAGAVIWALNLSMSAVKVLPLVRQQILLTISSSA